DPGGQQRHGAGAPRDRPRAQESLRLALGAWHPRRGALLHAARVREARGRRAGSVSRRGDTSRDRDARHGHASARSTRHVAAGTAAAIRGSEATPAGYSEHVPFIDPDAMAKWLPPNGFTG